MAHPRLKAWQGVRTRLVWAASDPDEAPRQVELPASWDDGAATAVAALDGPASTSRPLDLRQLAQAWLDRLPPDLAASARGWLLARRAAPDREIWRGGTGAFALNLAAFDEPGFGLDLAALRDVARQAVAALRVLSPDARPVLRVTDLDGMLAAAGLDYGSPAGRQAAVSVMSMLRDEAGEARLLGAPGLVDALLGAEAGGVAPRFDWLDPAAHLSRAARAFLAARGLSAEAALAKALTGQSPLTLADAGAHAAMHEALRPFITLPEIAAPAAPTTRRELPPRPGGYARRVTLGGHKVFVRTAEFADGGLAEVSIGLPKESASVRAMADSLSHVASLALQHGTPLSDIIELLAGTRFGPAGTVDGDPLVARALSPLDYLARSLTASYLPDLAVEPVPEEEVAPELPLEMPAQARPRLRVVR